MHGSYATAKDVLFLRAPCVSPLHSPTACIFDKEDITDVSGRGVKTRISNAQILSDSLCILTPCILRKEANPTFILFV